MLVHEAMTDRQQLLGDIVVYLQDLIVDIPILRFLRFIRILLDRLCQLPTSRSHLIISFLSQQQGGAYGNITQEPSDLLDILGKERIEDLHMRFLEFHIIGQILNDLGDEQ
jgi:hypothetical protein